MSEVKADPVASPEQTLAFGESSYSQEGKELIKFRMNILEIQELRSEYGSKDDRHQEKNQHHKKL